jgi:predicted DNA-binding protein
MARPRKEEDEKAVGLHTSTSPRVAKEVEKRQKETGATRAFIVTKALEQYLEIPEENELIAS